MSEKLLPIVPGCRCIAIGVGDTPKHILHDVLPIVGKEVIVIYDYISPAGRKSWKIDHPKIYGVNEHLLIRIDGGEFEHEKDEQEIKL